MLTIRKVKKINILIGIALFSLPFILYSCFNFTSIKVAAGENKEKLEKIEKRWNETEGVKNIINNKVIIIGDSRMEYIEDRGKSIDIPINFSFIALGDTKIEWFRNKAIPSLREKLENKISGVKYHVVLNMGVNDLNDNNDPLDHSEDYYKLYEELANSYEDVNFYILSVNPLDMSIINIKIYSQKRTNDKIETFNENMVQNMEEMNIKNMYYCDSYHNVNFETRDGLHYNKKTDQNIINYITNSCLKYE